MLQKPKHLAPRYGEQFKDPSIKDFHQDYDMIEALEQHSLFHKVGEKTTAPVPFVQSVDDYIESFHSRNGFSRERMGLTQAEAFDQEAREILLRTYRDSIMSMQVVANIVWGRPRGVWACDTFHVSHTQG